MNEVVSSPNLSLVVPVGCNANCSFCFWDRKKEMLPSEKWLEGLNNILPRLPRKYRRISITGGEPTGEEVTDYLCNMCGFLRKNHVIDFAVMTTNGSEYPESKFDHYRHLDAINISRHHQDYEKNIETFRNIWIGRIMSNRRLRVVIEKYGVLGVPVTLSKVLFDNDNYDTICDYLDFARDMGASQVFLRKPHGDLFMHLAQETFDDYKMETIRCPVCITDKMIYKGMPVFWKRSKIEPSDTMEDYELIYHQDGALTYDWVGKKPAILEESGETISKDRLEYNYEYFRTCHPLPKYGHC